MLLTLLGEAAMTSWPPWRRMAAVFEPIRPVPPMTMIFMEPSIFWFVQRRASNLCDGVELQPELIAELLRIVRCLRVPRRRVAEHTYEWLLFFIFISICIDCPILISVCIGCDRNARAPFLF